MDKVVLKLDLHDDKQKQKAMMAVSCLSGVESISMDMKERTLTVIGDVDPVTVVSKLRKSWLSTKIVSVGPAKEDGKKDDGKKVDGKKDDGKKDDEKKEDGKKDDGKKKMDEKKVSVGLAKEPEKKKDDGKKEEDGKKDDGKEDGKKEDGKKDDGNKEDGKKKVSNEQYREFMRTYGYRAPAYTPYHAYSDEENPNTCVIS